MRIGTWIDVAMFGLLVGACGGRRTEPAETSTKAPSKSAMTTPVSPTDSPTPSRDVVKLSRPTSRHGDVFAVGQARLRLSGRDLGPLAISVSGKRVFAVDRNAVKVWDLATGILIKRLEPRLGPVQRPFEDPINMAVSPDGSWLVAGYFDRLQFRTWPFDRVAFELELAHPFGFTPDSTAIVCGQRDVPSIVDLAQHKVVATAAEQTFMLQAQVTADQQTLYIARKRTLLRWDRATGKVQILHTTPTRLPTWALSTNGRIAVVTEGKGLVRIDLTTGATRPLTSYDSGFFALSPSGNRLALYAHELRVLDTSTGRELWSSRAFPTTRIAYSEREDVFAYLDDSTIRVIDVGKGARTYPTPSRFVGWLGEGVAAISRDGKVESLALATGSFGQPDGTAVKALEPARPAKAPAWASWITPGPDGVVAAEPNPRHDLMPWRRYLRDCPDRLRVWTAKGGVQRFAIRPTQVGGLDNKDACWEIGGGRVAGVTTRRVRVFDPQTGKPIAKLEAATRQFPDSTKVRVDRDELADQYYAAALSPSGDHLAVIRRRADLIDTGDGAYDTDDPRFDPDHVRTISCYEPRVPWEGGSCKQEYFAEVWSLRGTPKRVWQGRFDGTAEETQTERPMPKDPTGAIAFTPDGQRILFGFQDGAIVIRSTTGTGTAHVEHLHDASITRIVVAPGGKWVFSEDSAGEQRLWALAP